jgi:N-acetyl-beta-hexosaminidase
MNHKIIENFLSEQECDNWIKYIDEKVESLTDPIRKRGDNRFNEFLPELSDELALKLEKKGSGRITFVKYAKNSNGIARHTDIIVEKGVTQTGVVYLNTLQAGQTVLFFDDKEIQIQPVKGRLLLFDIPVPHMSLPPLQEKYILIFRVCLPPTDSSE